MAQTVNANSLAVTHKSSAGAPSVVFPDVCKTPIAGGPVAIPYPNVAASAGTRTGYAGGKVKVGQKDDPQGKSVFKASSGDEAGAAAGKGVISSRAAARSPFKRYSYKGHGVSVVSSPAAGKGLAVNAPPPIPCGNPDCPHYTARVPATQTAQLPADKADGLLSPIVCLQCYRKFAGIEPLPAATGR